MRYSPETVEGVVTYTAVLTVDNSDLLLRPGMTATADITVETVKDAIQVPNAALRWSPPVATARTVQSRRRPARPADAARAGRGQAAAAERRPTAAAKVWVLRDGAPVGVPVTIGSSDGTHTAVTGDLTVKRQGHRRVADAHREDRSRWTLR